MVEQEDAKLYLLESAVLEKTKDGKLYERITIDANGNIVNVERFDD